MAKEMQIFWSVSPTYVVLKLVSLVCMCVRRVCVNACVRECMHASESAYVSPAAKNVYLYLKRAN